jgi:hypothetical protein
MKAADWSEVAARAGRMSAHEIYTRLRQAFSKRWDVFAWRAGIAPPAPPARALQAGCGRFFFESQDLSETLELVRHHATREAEETVADAETILRHEIPLLGYGRLAYGPEIDWHLDIVHGKRAPLRPWHQIPYLDFETVGDHKVIWELNRHQHLVTLALAAVLANETRFTDELVRQWRHWQEHNPYPLGINWASSLEVAFRSLSWIWVDRLLEGSEAAPERFRKELRAALAANGRYILKYLSAYFAPNTHLLGEVVALFFIGAIYPDLPGARRSRSEGWRIICQEMERQVRADGLHFEQSIYYHVYALDFFLHARLLAQRNAVPIPAAFDRKLAAMFELLAAVSAAGVTPGMGDDDGGRVFRPSRNRAEHMLDPLGAGAALFHRPGWKGAGRGLTIESILLLGPGGVREYLDLPATPRAARSRACPDSGIYVLVSSEPELWQLTVDAGPFGYGNCGHAHADALSVQLAGAGAAWLVDTGTGSYMEREARERLRGTRSHNTLEVDGVSHAVPDLPFRWKNPPHTLVERWENTPGFDYLRASHDGYQRLPARVVHRRHVARAAGFWFILDEIGGEGRHELLISWHFAPGLEVREIAAGGLLAVDPRGRSLTLLAEGGEWQLSIEEGSCSPVYGAILPCPIVRFRAACELPAWLATVLIPGEPECAVTRGEAHGARCYDLTIAGTTHRLLFGERPWWTGHCEGDAEFALFQFTAAGLELVGAAAGAVSKMKSPIPKPHRRAAPPE